MKNKRLRLWGAADIGEGFISTVSNTYFSMFLTDIALLPLGLVSVVMMITSVFDFVVAPIAGALITMIKPGKWGRLRSWFVYMPLITTVAYALCYVPVSSGVVCAALITLFYCIARCTYNITWASNLSMIDLVADSPSTRTKLTSQRMAGFNIGKLSSGYVTPVLVAAVAVSIGDRYSYAVMMIVAGVVMTAGYAVHFFLSAGYEDTASTVGDSEPRVGLKQILQALVTNPQLLVTVLIDLTSNMGSFLLPALATYYYKYVAQDTNLLALHMLLTGFGGLAGTLLIRFAGDKIEDHRRTLLAVYPVIALVLFSCRFVAEIPVLFLALNVLCQTITGFTQPLELQLYMDNVIYHKYKTGVDANGFIMSMCNVSVKLATVLKSVIIPFVLMTAGYVAGAEPTEALKQGIVDAYTIIPAIIPLVGFVMLRFFYKLSRTEVYRMKEEMKAKES